ncbi:MULTISPECIES: glycosyltransferase [unclassified Citrobacter]|uniref:glycosyltransferase n=1 Tax=unclassified Citrobacter TaxID=2644389 RepID=UPI0005F094F3|nr:MULTISPECIES: glycosyltransferase [unclassified Citrobacter]MDM2941661.1 glycosyltransferase family 4 protein [Citrobacter sp. Cm038]
MYKVLFISAFHPGAKGTIGAGEAICGDNLKRHIRNGSEVDVIVIAPSSQYENPEIKSLCHTYELMNVGKREYFNGVRFNLKHKSFVAPWFFTRVSEELVDRVKYKMSHKKYDMIWLDFPSVLGLVKHISHDNIVYFAHDVVSQRTSRSLTKRPINSTILRIESDLFKRLKSIITMSKKDSELIQAMNYKGQVSVADLGIQKVGEVFNSVPIERVVSEFGKNKNIIFFGNMKRSENHWSIVWFVFFVFFKLIKQQPNLHLWILGLGPRPILKIIGKCVPHVHVIGAVSDPTLAFQKADLSVAPLLYGAGVKIKVLQMLDAGARVVATDVGAEGIQQHENLYVVDKFSIGNKILELLD